MDQVRTRGVGHAEDWSSRVLETNKGVFQCNDIKYDANRSAWRSHTSCSAVTSVPALDHFKANGERRGRKSLSTQINYAQHRDLGTRGGNETFTSDSSHGGRGR